MFLATDFKAQIRAVVIAVQGSPSKWRLSCSGQRVANECGEIAALNGFPANESPNVTWHFDSPNTIKFFRRAHFSAKASLVWDGRMEQQDLEAPTTIARASKTFPFNYCHTFQLYSLTFHASEPKHHFVLSGDHCPPFKMWFSKFGQWKKSLQKKCTSIAPITVELDVLYFGSDCNVYRSFLWRCNTAY